MDDAVVERINAPFTDVQVIALNRWQRSGFWAHPFTCLNRGDGKHRYRWGDKGVLVATTEGWICLDCDYRQSWAWDVMARS